MKVHKQLLGYNIINKTRKEKLNYVDREIKVNKIMGNTLCCNQA